MVTNFAFNNLLILSVDSFSSALQVLSDKVWGKLLDKFFLSAAAL